MFKIIETVKTHKTQSALIGAGAIMTLVGAILFAKAKKDEALAESVKEAFSNEDVGRTFILF